MPHKKNALNVSPVGLKCIEQALISSKVSLGDGVSKIAAIFENGFSFLW